MPVWSNGLFAKQPIVVGVATDPEPHETVRRLDGEGAVVSSDSSGPEASCLLELKRWIPRILLEAIVCLISKTLHLRRQRPVGGPEIGGGVMDQSRVVLPAAWSRRAFSARASSLPFWISRSS